MGNVKGLSRVRATIKKVSRDFEKEVETGLIKAGLRLQREAQILTPVDTGALRNSAKTIPTGSGFKTEVFVTFGQHYGIFVHENMTANHPIGQAKFLEIPAKKMAENLAETLIFDTSF